MDSRFQFSLRNAVWATFWVSVWFGSLTVVLKLLKPSWEASRWNEILALGLVTMLIATPSIAIEALFGRNSTGEVVRTIVTAALLVLLLAVVALIVFGAYAG